MVKASYLPEIQIPSGLIRDKLSEMKRKWIILLSILGLLIILRLIAPHFLLKTANNKLSKIERYRGVVEDVDLRLYKGTYIIDSSYFMKKTGDFEEPFMAAEEVEIMVDWDALFRNGKLVALIIVNNAEMNFSVRWKNRETGEKIKQFGKGVDWLQHFKKMSPLMFNRLIVKNSRINYIDYTTEPVTSAYLNDIRIHATNLQNITSKDEPLPGDMTMSATTMGGGILDFSSRVNFVKKPMDLNINMTIEGMDIVDWNDFMIAYTSLDFESGVFNLYSEIEVKNGKVNGYVKPLIDNVSLLNWDQEKGSFLDKAWEAIAGAVTEVFENQEEDQLSTRVPISGEVKGADADVLTGIWNIFKNAFIEAFNKELEHDVDPGEE